jgi:hypothetical protein
VKIKYPQVITKIIDIMKRAIFFFAVLLTACGTKNLKEVNDLRYIDVAGGVGKSRTFNLSEIADSIEYIPLETSNESLIGDIFANKIYMGNHILYIPLQDQSIKIFNKKGEYINTFRKKGRGPGEYEFLAYLDINHTTGSTYIQGHRKIIEYKNNSEYIRTIYFPENKEIDCPRLTFFRNIGNHFLIYNYIIKNSIHSAVIIDSNSRLIKIIEYPLEEQMFIKKLSRITDINNPKIIKYKNNIRIINGVNKYVLNIAEDLSIDTAYIFNFGKYDVKTKSITNLLPDAPYLWQRLGAFESDNYLFLMMHVGPILKKPTILLDAHGKEFNYNHACSFFNKKTGEFSFIDQPMPYKLGFKDDFEGGPPVWPLYISADNYMISIMTAFNFISFTQENSVSDKLKAMAGKLKETDNHILVKVKLKSL